MPEVVIDEYELSEHCVSATPPLQCDLNEVPEVVADEVVSDHVVSKTVIFTSFCDTGVDDKGGTINGIICDGCIDVNNDETELFSAKSVEKVHTDTDTHLHTHSTAAEQEHNGHGNRMNLQTPQQKLRRKKHRPKVLVDGYKPRVKKTKATSTFRKVKERLPNKRKFLSEIVPDDAEPVAIQSTRKSTKRLLDFDSKGLTTDDMFTSNSEGFESFDHFHINGEARGEKRGYSSMSGNFINIRKAEEHRTHLAYAGLLITPSCSTNLPNIPFLQISKRRRTTKGKRSLASIKSWLATAKSLSKPMVMNGCLGEIQRMKSHTLQAKRSKGFVRLRRFSFSSLMFKFFKRKYKAVQDFITDGRVLVLRKKRSRRISKGKAWSNVIKMEQLYQKKLVPYNYQRPSIKSRGILEIFSQSLILPA